MLPGSGSAGYYVGEDPHRASFAASMWRPEQQQPPQLQPLSPLVDMDLYPTAALAPAPAIGSNTNPGSTTITMTPSLHLPQSPAHVSSVGSAQSSVIATAPLRTPLPPQPSSSANYHSSAAPLATRTRALDGSPASPAHMRAINGHALAPVTRLATESATTPESEHEYRAPRVHQRQSDVLALPSASTSTSTSTSTFVLRAAALGVGAMSPGRHSKVIASLNDAEPAPGASGQRTPLAHSHSDPTDSSAQSTASASTTTSSQHDYHFLWNTGQMALQTGTPVAVVNPFMYSSLAPLQIVPPAAVSSSSTMSSECAAPTHVQLKLQSQSSQPDAAANSGSQLSYLPVTVDHTYNSNGPYSPKLPLNHTLSLFTDTSAAAAAAASKGSGAGTPTKTSSSSSASSPQKAPPPTERRVGRTNAAAGPSHAHSLQHLQTTTTFESAQSMGVDPAVASASGEREPRSEKTKRKSPGNGLWRSRSLRFTRNSPTPPSNESSDRSSPPHERKESLGAAASSSQQLRGRKGSLSKRLLNLLLGKKGSSSKKALTPDDSGQNTLVGSTANSNSTVSLNGAIASPTSSNNGSSVNENELLKGNDTYSKAQRVEESSQSQSQSQKARTECATAAEPLHRISSTRSNMSQSSGASSASTRNKHTSSRTTTPRPQPKPGDSPGQSLRSVAAQSGARAHSPIPFANAALSLTNPAATDLDDADDDVFLDKPSSDPSGRSPSGRKQAGDRSPESSQSRFTTQTGGSNSNEKLSSSLSDPKLAPGAQQPLLSPITEERSPDSRSR